MKGLISVKVPIPKNNSGRIIVVLNETSVLASSFSQIAELNTTDKVYGNVAVVSDTVY